MLNVDPEVTERELIVKAHQGDVVALETLLQNYYHLIYSVAYRLSKTREDAEDTTQEALIRIARFIKSYRGDSKFSTWIYRIVVNTSSDLRRSASRHGQLQEQLARDMQSDQEVGGPSEISKEIKAALVLLSEKEQKAIVLSVYEGLNHAEIAKIMGCAESTVSWHIFRAKKKLRKELHGVGV